MSTFSLLGFVFGVFGLIAFGQVRSLKREVRELRRIVDEDDLED